MKLIAKTRKINLPKCKSKEEEEKIVKAFRNCVKTPCKDCPWEECENSFQDKIMIPKSLANAVLYMIENVLN